MTISSTACERNLATRYSGLRSTTFFVQLRPYDALGINKLCRYLGINNQHYAENCIMLPLESAFLFFQTAGISSARRTQLRNNATVCVKSKSRCCTTPILCISFFINVIRAYFIVALLMRGTALIPKLKIWRTWHSTLMWIEMELEMWNIVWERQRGRIFKGPEQFWCVRDVKLLNFAPAT